jgi:hypothetical protein
VFRVPSPLTGSCIQTLTSCRLGYTCPSHMCMFSTSITNLHTPSPQECLQDPYPSLVYSPHLSQKVCKQGRTLGHRYRSRQMLHTRNCLSIGCTSGPGLSSLFAMVTTDGFCHSHQPVYREIVSSKMARPPSPYHSNPQQRNVNKRTHTHTHTHK